MPFGGGKTTSLPITSITGLAAATITVTKVIGALQGDVTGNLNGGIASTVCIAGTTETAYTKATEISSTADWPVAPQVVAIIKRPVTVSIGSILTYSADLKHDAVGGPNAKLDLYYLDSAPPALGSTVLAATIAAAPYYDAGVHLTHNMDTYTRVSGALTSAFYHAYLIVFLSRSGGGVTTYVRNQTLTYDEGTPETGGVPWAGCS